MNETGLVVEQMTLPETVYPAHDERPAIKDMQWIQYMLDTCSTVNEVCLAASDLRIAQSTAPLHYMVCDQNGEAAIIEYLEGRLICYTRERLPFAISTNSSYRDSLAYYHGTLPNPANNPYTQNSLKRFTQSVAFVEDIPAEADLNFELAFGILDSVKREDTTWQIIYNLREMRIYWKKQPYWLTQTIDFKRFDFTKNETSKVIHPASADHNGEVSIFDYSLQHNRDLAEKFFRNEALSQVLNLKVTEEMLDYFAGYPEQMK